MAGALPGPPGACSPEHAEWQIYASGSYAFTWNSHPCGGATAYGHYDVRGDVLSFFQQSVPNCATCTQHETIHMTYRFVGGDNNLRLCDYPMGACYTYSRQR